MFARKIFDGKGIKNKIFEGKGIKIAYLKVKISKN